MKIIQIGIFVRYLTNEVEQSRGSSPIFSELAHETLVFYYFLMGLIQFRELAPQRLGNQTDYGTDCLFQVSQ